MRKIVFAIVLVISFGIYMPQTQVDASSSYYTVQSGDSLWKISQKHGVSLSSLRSANNKWDNMIYPGDRLVIPSSISASEKDLLARLVHAEAKGEPYAGKVAVATVVLNRVDSSQFPNSIKGVIYEVAPGGHYAFSPVKNGAINEPADASAYRAVEEALAFRGQGNGSLYFYNPKTAQNTWITTKQVTVEIGNHRFAK